MSGHTGYLDVKGTDLVLYMCLTFCVCCCIFVKFGAGRDAELWPEASQQEKDATWPEGHLP